MPRTLLCDTLKDDTAIILENGNGSIKLKVKVMEKLGEGSTAITYLVKCLGANGIFDTEMVMKEFFPVADKYGAYRDDDNSIKVPCWAQDSFDNKRERFKNSFKIQRELQITENNPLSNHVFQNIDIYTYNGNTYAITTTGYGGTLSDQNRELTLNEKLSFMCDFAKVMKMVHDKGYIMMDIKPENIYLAEGASNEVRLFDFDSFIKVEHLKDEDIDISHTKKYSAPEVQNGLTKKISFKSDTYSFGITLFEILFGSTDVDVKNIRKRLTDEYGINFDFTLAGVLKNIFSGTVAKKPQDRYCDEDLIALMEKTVTISTNKKPYVVYSISSASEQAAYRDKELEELYNILKNEKKAIITAMGGIGKSELARMYVAKYKDEYDIVQFVNYSNSMESTLLNIDIGNLDPEIIKDKQLHSAAINNLLDAPDGRILLVVENFDEETSGEDLDAMMSKKNIDVIFTSRLKIEEIYHRYNDRVLKLETLTDKNAEELFKSFYQSYSDYELSVIEGIINAVDKNTLLIKLAALEMQEHGIDGNELLDRLKSADIEALSGEIVHEEKYKELYAHLLTVFDTNGFNKAEKTVLLKMSLVPYIEKDNVKSWLGLDNFNIVNKLRNRGWIEDNDGKISVHSAVSILMYEKFYKSNKKITSKFLVSLYCTKFCQRLIKFCCRFLKDPNQNDCESLINSLILYLGGFEESLYGERIKMEEYADFSGKRINGSNLMAASFYYVCGRLYRLSGRYNEALTYFEKSKYISECVCMKNNVALADVYNEIGLLFDSMGDYDKALRYHEKSLRIKIPHKDLMLWCKENGAEDEFAKLVNIKAVATSWDNMGIVYMGRKDYKTAMEFFQKALDILKGASMENGLEASMIYHNIGSLYAELKDFDKALEYLKKALDIKIREIGENTIETATTYNNMAGVYYKKGEGDKVLEYCQKVQDILIPMTGERNGIVASTYNTLGMLYKNEKKYEKALEYLNKSLDIRILILGENAFDTANVYRNMGSVYRDMKKLDVAIQNYSKALDIIKFLKYRRKDESDVYTLMGEAYVEENLYDEALECLKKAADLRIELKEEYTDKTERLYFNIGGLYARMKVYDKSIYYLNKALDIQKLLLGEKDFEVATSYINLGDAYFDKKDYKDALNCYKNALDILSSLYEESSMYVLTAYEKLNLTYRAMGDFAKASYYLNKLNGFVCRTPQNHSQKRHKKKNKR